MAEFQEVYRFDPVEGNAYNNMVGNILEEMSRLTNNYFLPKVVVIEGDENYLTLLKRDLIEDSTKQYPLSAEQFAESFASITNP
jgi:hemerythrin-like domain-containing protein